MHVANATSPRVGAGEHVAVARSYLARTGPFPERVAVLALTGGFLTDFAEMVDRWAQYAITTIEAWPEDPRRAEPDWTPFEELVRRHRVRRP